MDKATTGLIDENDYGYRQASWLVVCYDRLCEFEKAQAYNILAGEYKPEDPSVNYNKGYFENRK